MFWREQPALAAPENGHKNAAENNPYWRVLPAADYGHKNNTPFECAATESYSIHERLLKTAQQQRGHTPRQLSVPHIQF